jgi:hypothetical protein
MQAATCRRIKIHAFMPSRHALARCRPLAWLLALALWLPVAQWVSATHVLHHLHTRSGEAREEPAQLPASCDIHLAVAAISGGAPLPATRPPLPALPPHALPQLAVADGVATRPSLPYRSRAPPLPHA